MASSGAGRNEDSSTRTTGVRGGHELDEVSLKSYLDRRASEIPGYAPGSALSLKQFNAGQSNPTYLLTATSPSTPSRAQPALRHKYVLRKRPRDVKVASAHAVDREFAVLRALHGTAVPVPAVYVLCLDETVIGASFYVMEFVEGRIFDDPAMPGLRSDERREAYCAAAGVLASLHAQDWRRLPGLAKFGRAGNYFGRQIKRLSAVSDTQAEDADAIPDKEELVADLGRGLEAAGGDAEAVLIHGDFKIDNLVYSKEGAGPIRVIAVLDWELATIGHPMADVANCSMIHHTPRIEGSPLQGLTGLDLGSLGIPDAVEFARVYCAAARRPFPDPHWRFALAFLFFKNAVIAQGVASRAARGVASSSFAGDVAAMVPFLAMTAVEFLREQKGELAAAAEEVATRSRL